MTLLDEIETDVWHILTSVYTYRRIVESLSGCSTRYDLANNLVALDALTEMIVLRTARLADKRKDVRSISMLLKKGLFSDNKKDVETSAEKFLQLAVPVLKIRHEKIAHMKPGILSSYSCEPIPKVVIHAIEALIDLVDIASARTVSYYFKVGAQEAVVDLRASVQQGIMVTTQRFLVDRAKPGE